jgi:cytochrome P450 PksS
VNTSRGRLIDLTRSEHKADPFPLYARLRESAPVQRARMGRIEGYLLTRYDDVLAALKDPRLAKNLRRIEGAAELSRRPWLPGFLRAMESNMLDQDDPNHARLRALVHRVFTPARIERLRPRIGALANELLDRVQGRGELELIRDFALPLPLTVIGELLGVPPADRVRFQRLSQGALLPPTTLNVFRMLPAMWALIRYVQQLLASANRDPAVFTRPDELDLAREPNRHLAFGYGIHFCLGAALARMEGQIALDLLLQRLSELRLAVPADELRWRATPIVRGLSALPLRFRS